LAKLLNFGGGWGGGCTPLLTFMRIRTLIGTIKEEDKEVGVKEEEEVKNKNQEKG
jgi:hypothetical protein